MTAVRISRTLRSHFGSSNFCSISDSSHIRTMGQLPGKRFGFNSTLPPLPPSPRGASASPRTPLLHTSAASPDRSRSPCREWRSQAIKEPTSGSRSFIWKVMEKGVQERTDALGVKEVRVRCNVANCPEREFWEKRRSLSRCYDHMDKVHGLKSQDFRRIAGDAERLHKLLSEGHLPPEGRKRRKSPAQAPWPCTA